MKLSDLSEILDLNVLGDGQFESLGIVKCQSSNVLTFLENGDYLSALLENSQITSVVTRKEFVEKLPDRLGIIVSTEPRKQFYEIHNYLAQNTNFYSPCKGFSTEISDNSKIHKTAYVAPTDVKIGRRVIIEPNVTILENTIIEDDVIIRSGAVIGCEGYEFKHLGKSILPIKHAGGVLIRSKAEIGGNTVVDRSVFEGYTEIGEEVKIDNLVNIAHGVYIGQRSMIVALAMICGGVSIGKDVWIGPSAVISNGIRIGDGAFVTLGSVVTRDVAPGQRVTGNWAIEHEKFIAFMRSIR